MPFKQTIVLVDADNTLWDTDAVFRSAQLLLLARVEEGILRTCPTSDRLEFIRTYDQSLAHIHHLHLRYPPQLLVRSIEAGLSGVPPEIAARDAIAGRFAVGSSLDQVDVEAIVRIYIDALTQMPELLPTVSEGVNLAKKAGLQMYVMTEGRIDKQKRLLDLYDLHSSFEGVWELTKERAQFDRVITRFAGQKIVVIGDQPDRDVVPAKAAGCTTVLIPSRFKPSWHAVQEYEVADHVATNFLGAITWCINIADGRQKG